MRIERMTCLVLVLLGLAGCGDAGLGGGTAAVDASGMQDGSGVQDGAGVQDGGGAQDAQSAADSAASDAADAQEGGADALAPDAQAQATDADSFAPDATADAQDAATDAGQQAGSDGSVADASDTTEAPDVAQDSADEVAQAVDAAVDVGVDAGADVPAAKSGIYAGHCAAPFPMPAKQSWTHPFASPLTVLEGPPNHRIRDLILPVGKGDKLRGRFTYGVLDTDLTDEAVQLWVQTCPGWVKWGQLQTDADGIVYFDVPANLPPGDYRLKMVVLGDQTVADGELAVWPPGVRAVVTDVDGTLTTSDWQLVQDVIFGKDAEMYADADTVMNAWAQKDYRLVYLTGRPQVVNRYTRTWLANHGFPAGTLHLTEDLGQLPPTEAGVQKFKTDFLAAIQAQVGAKFRPAYGNAPTDAGAYLAVGIDKADVYLIGPNAGVSATQPVSSYTSHLPKIAGYPDAIQP